MTNTVTIKAVGERCTPLIHVFMSESEARAFILGWQEAIHIPSGQEWKIILNGKEL